MPMTIRAGTNNHACAACKFQRRKCNPDCLLAPHFPGNQPEVFKKAHRLFGVKNIINILKQAPDLQKEDAMKSIIYESNMRAQFPVHGCLGYYNQLLSQVQYLELEVYHVKKQLAFHKGQPYHDQFASSSNFPLPSQCHQLDINMSKGGLPSYYPSIGSSSVTFPSSSQSASSVMFPSSSQSHSGVTRSNDPLSIHSEQYYGPNEQLAFYKGQPYHDQIASSLNLPLPSQCGQLGSTTIRGGHPSYYHWNGSSSVTFPSSIQSTSPLIFPSSSRSHSGVTSSNASLSIYCEPYSGHRELPLPVFKIINSDNDIDNEMGKEAWKVDDKQVNCPNQLLGLEDYPQGEKMKTSLGDCNYDHAGDTPFPDDHQGYNLNRGSNLRLESTLKGEEP